MARVFEVARVEEVPPGTATVIQVGETELAQWDVATADFQLGVLWALSNGALERFPTLRLAFLEGNLGWFPWLIDKMSLSHEHLAGIYPPPAISPLEQFRSRCWISGEAEERYLPDVVRLVGANRCLWASDFPHYESTMDPLVGRRGSIRR